jgi:hypothetical protein
VPYNLAGYQYAYSGNGYISICTYGGNPEFAGHQLASPLVINSKYYVTIKVSATLAAGNLLKYVSNNQGILFTTAPHVANVNPLPVNNFAHLVNTALISDTVNWTTLRWSFIADSSYQYIVLGNFFADSLTNGYLINPLGTAPYAAYYIDDVCVSTDSLTCEGMVGIEEQNNVTPISIFPNPFTDKINFTIKRNELSEIIIYDITSRKILNETFTNSISINTETFAKGIYLYEVRSKNGLCKKGKVVKD